MRKLLLAICFIIAASCVQAQKLERIEPMNWWVGMHNPKLQLLVHGENIALLQPQLNYPGVTLTKVNKVENPNYLFLDLEISKDTKAGTFPIQFVLNGKKKLQYDYELKNRDQSASRIQSVTSADLIYLLMPDRFANGDKKNDIVKGMREIKLNRDSMYYRHGGDIQGLIGKLDYLKDLGVTAVWMTPEIENDMVHASYHGYAATDHYKIDPRYGTLDLYKKYVDEAHKRGLKVVKDIVHNHMGSTHWFFLDMPMKDWVNQWPVYTQTSYRDEPVMDPYTSEADKKKMLDGWFVPTMPDFNHRNPFVQTYITQNHIWWVEYAGIDGLRLDTYPYNDPEYMKDWYQKIHAEFPTLSVFGETLVHSAAAQAYFTGGNTVNRGFDTELPGVTDAVIKDAIYEALNGKNGWADGVFRLYSTVAQDFLYKHADQNVIFMDNHDMSRFYSMINEDFDRFKSGMSILLTMRGIPQIYYGTEILMKNYSNPDGLVRSDFPGGWPEDKVNKFTAAGRTEKENEAFNFVKTLANYRKNSTALKTGKLMQYVPEHGIYTYFRYTANHNKTVMVIVNNEDQAKTLDSSRFEESIKNATSATNIITNQKLNTLKTIAVPAKTTLVLELN
ncbi:glycoside hydrolase family 13 protein [Pedobacter sp. MC2016-24]|uniref:glycoside hydrolase family 13 protein n=1 Tax=Pedobacter sp. MC2016-24 TaxID=2780090 RepID=UPI0018824C4E|nr:glycoside hydrolase family 13 protein [Pedobacter sp. MC2016-24]MBE9599168.1 glycoside hydrolase family 13 protein [Pedobacter sp. MC2016-24]